MNRTNNELHRCNDDESNKGTFTDKVKRVYRILKEMSRDFCLLGSYYNYSDCFESRNRALQGGSVVHAWLHEPDDGSHFIITFLAALAVAIINPKAAAVLCIVALLFTVIAIIKEGPGLQK